MHDALVRLRTYWLVGVLAILASTDCDGCARRGTTQVCRPCAESGECAPGLFCVNGVCETAPPMCHVEIGL